MRFQPRYQSWLLAVIQSIVCVTEAGRILPRQYPQELRDVVRANPASAMKPLQEIDRAVSNSPVEVEMFTMSKCPDARDCVRDLVLPVMAELYQSGILTLRPTFIGTPDDANAGMACKHGPDECLGDILELCAYELHKSRPEMWLGFINCMGLHYEDIPRDAHVTNCALEYGLTFEELEKCASSEDPDRGMELLRASGRRAIELDISTSCTITVNGKTVCVRDDGQWKECTGKVEDLKQVIQRAYNDGQ